MWLINNTRARARAGVRAVIPARARPFITSVPGEGENELPENFVLGWSGRHGGEGGLTGEAFRTPPRKCVCERARARTRSLLR